MSFLLLREHTKPLVTVSLYKFRVLHNQYLYNLKPSAERGKCKDKISKTNANNITSERSGVTW